MQKQPTQSQQEDSKPYNIFLNQKPNQFYLKSVNKYLNEFLEGGLHTGMITQIYGQSGGGKTQMAMLFAISALSSNMIVGYLATQKELHWGRFTQLAYQYMNQSEFDQKQSLFKYQKCIDDFDVQMNFIERIFKQIEDSQKGGLIVIDNVYSFINASFTYFKIQNAYEKTRKQAQIINKIRKYAKTTNSCVLLVNKVSDVLQKRRRSLNGRQTIPALGTSWQLNIDQSFELKKAPRSGVRQLNVIQSPKCSQSKILFRIQDNGFTFINEQGLEF